MSPDPRPPGRVVDVDAIARFRLEHLGEPCAVCERRPGVHVHHVTFRSQSGDDHESNFLWLCYLCHDDIHAGRSERYRNG